MSDGDPYGDSGKVHNEIKRIKSSEKITETQRELLLEYKDYLLSKNISDNRTKKYLGCMRRLCHVIEFDLKDATKKDTIRLTGRINKDRIDRGKLAYSTKLEYKKSVKSFYGHFMNTMYDHPDEDIDYEDLVTSDIINLTKKPNYVDPDTIPGPNTIRKIVRHMSQPRDKAVVMTGFATGARIKAILGLRWKDVTFNKDVATITFRGTKTGGNRDVPIHVGHLYLKHWKEADPHGDNPDAYIFRPTKKQVENDKGELITKEAGPDDQLTYNALRQLIDRAVDRVNDNPDAEDIPDRIKTNPKAMFRKARATLWAMQGMQQSTLEDMLGWSRGSKEAARYIRIGQKAKESAVKRIAGLDVDEEEAPDDLKPLQCHECGEWMRWEASNCSDCGTVLSASKQFDEARIEKTKERLKTEMIKEGMGVDDEEVREKARELVEQDLNKL